MFGTIPMTAFLKKPKPPVTLGFVFGKAVDVFCDSSYKTAFVFSPILMIAGLLQGVLPEIWPVAIALYGACMLLTLRWLIVMKIREG